MATEAEKTLKDVRVAVTFCFAAVLIVATMLLIDGHRNKWIMQKVAEMRSILGQFNEAVGYAAGQAAASVGGDPGGAADNCDDCGGKPAADLESASAAGTGESPNGVAGNETLVVSETGRAGGAGGPRGDG